MYVTTINCSSGLNGVTSRGKQLVSTGGELELT